MVVRPAQDCHHASYVTAVAGSSALRHVVSASRDGYLHVSDAATGVAKCALGLARPALCAAFLNRYGSAQH